MTTKGCLGRSVLVVALFVVGVLGLFLWGFNQPIELPKPSGSFDVGRVTYSWIPGKSLALVIWYPVNKGAGGTPAPYNPTIAGRLLDGQPDPMEENLASVRGNAVTGAPISNAHPKYPALVFWPGYGWQPSRYAILAEELASDGYVVAGISPDYSTGNLDDTLTSRRTVELWAGPEERGSGCLKSEVVEDSSATSGFQVAESIDDRSARRIVQKQIDWGSSCCPRSFGTKKSQLVASSRCSIYGSATARNHPRSSTMVFSPNLVQ